MTSMSAEKLMSLGATSSDVVKCCTQRFSLVHGVEHKQPGHQLCFMCILTLNLGRNMAYLGSSMPDSGLKLMPVHLHTLSGRIVHSAEKEKTGA